MVALVFAHLLQQGLGLLAVDGHATRGADGIHAAVDLDDGEGGEQQLAGHLPHGLLVARFDLLGVELEEDLHDLLARLEDLGGDVAVVARGEVLQVALQAVLVAQGLIQLVDDADRLVDVVLGLDARLFELGEDRREGGVGAVDLGGLGPLQPSGLTRGPPPPAATDQGDGEDSGRGGGDAKATKPAHERGRGLVVGHAPSCAPHLRGERGSLLHGRQVADTRPAPNQRPSARPSRPRTRKRAQRA